MNIFIIITIAVILIMLQVLWVKFYDKPLTSILEMIVTKVLSYGVLIGLPVYYLIKPFL